jgi:hypothetical protein
MALWVCAGCTSRYSVGAARCPECASTEYVEEGAEDMAKITVHGGPSNAAADEQEAGEDVSAGSSSSTSSEKEPTSPEPSEKPSPSPAPATGSRSRKGRTANRSAGGTDGGQETGTSETSSADE